MSVGNGAFGVHVNALVNAKNGQLLPVLNRIADQLEGLSSIGGTATVSAEITAEQNTTDNHQLSLQNRLALLKEREAAEVSEYYVATN